jgi:hypothetical protein
MKSQNQGTVLERSLLWMFKAYLASYLVVQESKSKNRAKKLQKAAE